MKAQQLKSLAPLYSAPEFLAEHKVVLGAVARIPAVQDLKINLALIEQRAYLQDLGAAESEFATITLHSLRHAGVIQMRLVVRVANELLADRPDLAALRVASNGAPTKAHIQALTAIADAVAHHRDAFAAEGLPASTEKTLRSLAKKLQEALMERETIRSANKQNTRDLADDLRRAHSAYRVIDAFICSELSTNRQLLATWKTTQATMRAAAA
jgi:hypothetical protein